MYVVEINCSCEKCDVHVKVVTSSLRTMLIGSDAPKDTQDRPIVRSLWLVDAAASDKRFPQQSQVENSQDKRL